MYTKELIERVKSAVNIVDVIGDYQRLTRHGRSWLGICPFHHDSTPSLTVNPSLQIYKCFACGAGGDVIKYVEHAEGCSFTEAVRIVAKKGNVSLPEDTDETAEQREARLKREQEKHQNQTRQAEFVSHCSDSAFQEYLQARRISPEAASVFCLGLAAEGEFRGRVTYPLYSATGVLAGWTGRWIGSKDAKVPKYKNSAESELFHKDELLFGLLQARQEIQRQDRVYIVEGQNDVIRMWMSGFRNTVAGSGTAFSEKQARLIQRFTQNVVLMYDGDAAGRKATLRTMRELLLMGFSVRVLQVPDGEDPDSWLLKLSDNSDADPAMVLQNHTKKWDAYLSTVYPVTTDADETAKNAQEMSKMIACVPNRIVRQQLMLQAAVLYKTDRREILRMVNEQKVPDGEWQQGLYGMDAAAEHESGIAYLTFSKDMFVEHLDDAELWLLWQGEVVPAQIQQMRQFSHVYVSEREATVDNAVLRALHADGRHIGVLIGEEDEVSSYTDWYLRYYAPELSREDLESGMRATITRDCIGVIADTDSTEREINYQDYRQVLNLPAQSYKKLLQELLQQKKDRREAERKRQDMADKTTHIDFYGLPEYVEEDELMKKQYEQYGFYPLMTKGNDPRPVAYVFKNEKGDGHSVVSDFYMEALLFVDPATDHSKRVIRLNHLHGGSQYVEWPSDVFVSLQDMKKRLFASGAYNFNGTPVQWDRIRQVLSYKFTDCYEARVFGWQPEGFLLLPNAVFYRAADSERDDDWRLEYMDNLGVAEVNGMRFYSPASSSIRLTQRQSDNPYEQDELSFYLEPQGKDRIDFAEWAVRMNEVFKVNDNGKWAVLFAIACNFRDFIYSVVGNFTALCFAGPTGSGKTEVAYAIRGLWQRRKASVFNLNSGTDAAFFATLEHVRNMPVIMEEYNDAKISSSKFQGLKAAVYDDQGRIKVKDISQNTTHASKTNAAPILLGQDTPQQDDGSLSNRVIICEVPRKEEGFTDAETAKFEQLKSQSETGLGNVLLEIVRQRPVFERYYKTIFFEEVARMKRATWSSTVNKDGLERVIHSVAILSATARLIEERSTLKLPWRYTEFYDIAVDKIAKQMESISTTSKLGAFFAALNTLMGTGRVLYGRELKIVCSTEDRIRVKDGIRQKDVEVGMGTKILYLHFDSCYSAYQKEAGGEALSKQTLKNYFGSHTAFIGTCKNTRFSWEEADWTTANAGDGTPYTTRQMLRKGFVSSAYMFRYDTLREMIDIDFEREQAYDIEAQRQQIDPNRRIDFDTDENPL